MQTTQPALDATFAVATPEHIAFTYRVAGPMVRMLAYIIDLALRAVVVVLAALPIIFLGLGAGIGLFLLLLFIVEWLLAPYVEWRWQGFTPGKKACNIRVIGVDGLPASFGACFLRNIMRTADVFPSMFTALASMVLSGRFQRLGDLAAGTVVVYDADQGRVRFSRPEGKEVKTLAAALPAEIASVVDGAALRAITAYVVRRELLHKQRRAEVALPMANVITQRLNLPKVRDPDLLLCAVHYRLTADTGDNLGSTAAQAATYLAKRQPAWRSLENLVANRAATTGSKGQPAAIRYATTYRGVCADLALADAYHLPRTTVTFLEQLVGRAHLHFYRRIAINWRALSKLIFVTVPGRLYGDMCLRVALFAFYGTFFLCATIGAIWPEQATAFISESMADDLRSMYREPPNSRGVDTGTAMYGYYIMNNVGISLACFASGIFFGVGSLLWLAANGVFLGFCFGFMATVDDSTRSHFFEFVMAHGPFELTGIALSGAAGMRLGLGLVRTKGLPRLQSLYRSARESVPIMGVAATMVAMAAPIEAFISPSSLPYEVKFSIMILCIIIVVGYLVVLGSLAKRRMGAESTV